MKNIPTIKYMHFFELFFVNVYTPTFIKDKKGYIPK